jgi:hypothetical protein
VGGALTAFDIPDLVATIVPRKVVLSGIKNQMMVAADQQMVEKDTEYPVSVYKAKNVSGNLRIEPAGTGIGDLVDWALR